MRNWITFLCVFAVLLTMVTITASLADSNMAFKITYLLRAPDGGVESLDGSNWISLPYIFKPGLETAADLIDDIGSASVVQVGRYVKSTGGIQTYTGYSGTNFALIPGEAVYVQMNTDVNYTIIGSHDSALALELLGPGAQSIYGNNWISYPYHGTAVTASDLIDDIGTGVVQVGRFVRSTSGIQSYTGYSGTNFSLIPGEGYLVQVSADIDYIPSHY